MQRSYFKLIKLTLWAVMLLWPLKAAAQQWHRMYTPHFTVIYPSNLGREARRVANTLEHIHEPVSQSLKITPQHTTIILRNQTTISNGMATILPWQGFQVEYFTFPMHDYKFLHNNDWLDLLSVHEFRHVVQFARFKKKSGDLPPWFFEGDAVGIETALTKGGRGRIPYFGILYKANLLEREAFSIVKHTMGSLKDPVPDYYKIGYYFTTHLRRQYGRDIMDQIFQNLGIFKTFDKTLEKVTGKNAKAIYEDTNQELQFLWNAQLEGLTITSAKKLNKRKSKAVYTDYLYPQAGTKGIVALKKGLATTPQFVWLDAAGKEKLIFTPGSISQEAGFHLVQDQLVWVEQVPDLFHAQYDHSVIQLYDLRRKKLKTLTAKSRYATASLSPDAKQIIALASDEAYNHQLVILEAETGKVMQRLPNPNNYYYLNPRFTADAKHIIAVQQVHQQAKIVSIALATGNSQDLMPPTDELIGHPAMFDHYIFYNSAYNGIDNIYALDLRTQKHYQVTSRKYGAYHAAISNDQQSILFHDFTKDGIDAAQMPFNPQDWIPLEKVDRRKVDYYEPLVEQENNADLLANIPDLAYPTKRFYPLRYIFNKPLSLILAVNVPYETKFRITTTDPLNTATLTLGYTAKLKAFEGPSHKFLTRFRYQAWYPITSLGGYIKKVTKHAEQTKQYIPSLHIGIQTPLVWMHGQFTHRLTLDALSKFIWKQKHHTEWRQDYQGSFARFSKKSPRDLYSKWAQELSIDYSHIPKENWQPRFLRTKLGIYLPGLRPHHALRLSTSHQYKAKHLVKKQLNMIPHSHYEIFSTENPQEVYNTSLDYAFPLAYPDWELSSFLMIQQLSANLFFDWAYLPNERKGKQAWGIDCLMHVPLLQFGVRYLHKIKPSTEELSFELALLFKLAL